MGQRLRYNTKIWLKRYILAEILGTVSALIAASIIYNHSHSYIAAAAAGWIAEGIIFYGYFITSEIVLGLRKHGHQSILKRIPKAIVSASTNLLVEFLPAELLDNFIIRPFAMFIVPQYIHPYPLGFIIGKLSADLIFYILAVIGYETKKRWLHNA